MAKAYIAEYAVLPTSGHATVAVPMEPAVTTQAVEFTPTAQSAAFGNSTRYVVITIDAEAHVLFGEDPTATTNHPKFPANYPIDRGVFPGHKISFITA